LYFLIVFGDNVEDVLGKGRFLLLLLVAAIVGDVAHILAEHSSSTPCIGASGGISAVIAYYALRFPLAHIGLEIFWMIPPMMGIAFWLGLFWRRTTTAGAWAATLASLGTWWLTTKTFFILFMTNFPARFGIEKSVKTILP